MIVPHSLAMAPADPTLAAVGVGLLATGWLVLHQHPRVALAAWMGVVCFVPVWLGVNVHVFVQPAVGLGLLVLVSAFPTRTRLQAADLLFLALVVLTLLPVVIGGTNSFATFPFLTDIALGYLLGRIVPLTVGLEWATKCVVIPLVIAAALATVEFLLRWNPFVQLAIHNSLYASWGSLQARGGIIRAEGAFGHSIALGCSLALAVPLTLAARWRVRLRILLTTLLLLGTVVSFSRSGMLCALLGLVLSIMFLGRRLPARLRGSLVALVLVGGVVLVPMIGTVFAQAGQEASGSADYRGQLTALIPDMAALGVSPAMSLGPSSVRSYGGFQSIDDELILFGLRYGWIPLAILLAGLLLALVALLLGRGRPATVALIAQIPALVTVALITQYGIFLAFVAGMAVASYDVNSARRNSITDSPEFEVPDRADSYSNHAVQKVGHVAEEVRHLDGSRARKMKLLDYWNILRARWLLVFSCGFLLALLAAASAFSATPQYRSTTSIYFSLPSGTSATDLSQGSTYTQAQVLSYAELASAPIVLDRVIRDLSLPTTASSLSHAVTASASTDTVIVRVTATGTDPEATAALANAVGTELQNVVRSVAPKDAKGQPAVDAATIAPASVPSYPFAPKKKRNIAIGLVGGLLIGVALAITRELLRTKPRDLDEIGELTGAPILAQLSRDRSLRRRRRVTAAAGAGPAAEAFRRLRTNLRYIRADREIDVVTVTSSVSAEGKSTTALNVAIACAEAGDRVLLIDADLRKPVLADYLGLEPAVGLTNVLADHVPLEAVLQKWAGWERLDVLTSGELPPNPTQLLDSAAMNELIEQARATYDLVIIDSPPLVPVSDAAVLTRKSSGAVLVTNPRIVHRSQITAAVTALNQVDGEVVGVVVNGLQPASATSYYGPTKPAWRVGWHRTGRRTAEQPAASQRAAEPSVL